METTIVYTLRMLEAQSIDCRAKSRYCLQHRFGPAEMDKQTLRTIENQMGTGICQVLMALNDPAF